MHYRSQSGQGRIATEFLRLVKPLISEGTFSVVSLANRRAPHTRPKFFAGPRVFNTSAEFTLMQIMLEVSLFGVTIASRD